MGSSTEQKSQAHLLEILKKHWGYDSFRPLQEEIINSVLSGKDTIALLPTGGGKSICYQVPAIASDGICIVVSPLISLMRDQVDRLVQTGIQARALTGSLSRLEQELILDEVTDGKLKLLYVAPERLQNEKITDKLFASNLSFFAIDEAHCISQWGNDFRPSYRNLSILKEKFPNTPIIALTATATQIVCDEIETILGMQSPDFYRYSFFRPNLRYVSIFQENKAEKVQEIVQKTGGTGIIYVRSRKETESIAMALEGKRISSGHYHAGLPYADRNFIQDKWIRNEVQVIVATNAFGMGIDKPDVRFVINYGLPPDMESYYQEAGRGGRDGKPAYAVLLYSKSDFAKLRKQLIEKYPNNEDLFRVFDCLYDQYLPDFANSEDLGFELQLDALVKRSGLAAGVVWNSLLWFEQCGFILIDNSAERYACLKILMSSGEILSERKNNPIADKIWNVLLRKFGGEAFMREVRFQPVQLFKGEKISVENVHHYLNGLSEKGNIQYQAQNGVPKISFVRKRTIPSEKSLNISWFKELRERAEARLAYMIGYATNTDKCRAQMISSYFGEKLKSSCNNCDYCLSRANNKLTSDVLSTLKKEYLDQLAFGPQEFTFLIKSAKKGNAAQKSGVLKLLLEQNIIKTLPDGRLSLNSQS